MSLVQYYALKALAHKERPLATEALGKFLGTVSLDSDEKPYAKLVDIKKDINTPRHLPKKQEDQGQEGDDHGRQGLQ